MQNEAIKTNTLNRDFTLVKNSVIHGTGVFAKKVIPKGTRIFEYAGERVLKKSLPDDLKNNLTSLLYVMNLNDTTVIDGERGGNDARFINHSCTPNCEVYFFDNVPYIYAMQEIEPKSELSFDYRLGSSVEKEVLSEAEKIALFPCNCGNTNCRKTLLYK